MGNCPYCGKAIESSAGCVCSGALRGVQYRLNPGEPLGGPPVVLRILNPIMTADQIGATLLGGTGGTTAVWRQTLDRVCASHEALRAKLAEAEKERDDLQRRLDSLDSFAGVCALLQAILDEHYPPNTIVCSDNDKADLGAQLTAAARAVVEARRERDSALAWWSANRANLETAAQVKHERDTALDDAKQMRGALDRVSTKAAGGATCESAGDLADLLVAIGAFAASVVGDHDDRADFRAECEAASEGEKEGK